MALGVISVSEPVICRSKPKTFSHSNDFEEFPRFSSGDNKGRERDIDGRIKSRTDSKEIPSVTKKPPNKTASDPPLANGNRDTF